ncbi:MAG: DMT family transporter [Longimicrobiales bacterium]
MNRKYNGPRFAPATPLPGEGSADLGLLLMAMIWGVNFPVIKGALLQIPPLAFNALRFPPAAFTVFLLLRIRGGVSWPERRDVPAVIGLGILGNVVYQGFFIFGMDGTLAGNASILLATIPIWTLLLSTLLRQEQPRPLVWIGIIATLGGMVMVVVGGNLSIEIRRSAMRGDFLMVGAAMTWATYTVSSRHLVQRYGSTLVAAWTLWVGTLGLVLLGVPSLLEVRMDRVTPAAWVGVAYAGILAIGLAYVLWNRGIKTIGSSRTAAYQNLVPVVALLVAWIWLREVPTALQISGAGIVLAGVYLARRGGRGNAQTDRTPSNGRAGPGGAPV